MTRIHRSTVISVALLGGLWAISGSTRPAFAQTDPAVGSWKLNVAKSRYSPGPAPKTQVVTITAAGKGIRVVSKGVDADGKATSTEYTASYDGRDFPVLFNLVYDSISLKRIDTNTSELVRKKAGKVVQNAKRAISADGKTMTVRTTGVDDHGRNVDNVAVFDRQ
jgi:hypothetical protein